VTIFISAVTGIKIAGMITIPVILRMEENQWETIVIIYKKIAQIVVSWLKKNTIVVQNRNAVTYKLPGPYLLL
jgi:hypothetical protein